MTKITIFKKNGKIWQYQIKGHSGYASEGSDIVCAGVSTAAQMALVGLKEVLKTGVDVAISDGFMQVEIFDLENESAQVLLKSMESTLSDIAKNYAKNVRMEVRDVY
jgi:hypothetical protein